MKWDWWTFVIGVVVGQFMATITWVLLSVRSGRSHGRER
jgi:hypothetical protein